MLGFLPFEFASYTRWSWALQPPYHTAGALKKGAHTLFAPVKAAAWGLFGLIFPLQTGTPGAFVGLMGQTSRGLGLHGAGSPPPLLSPASPRPRRP